MTEFSALQRQFAAHIRNPFDNAAPTGIEDRRMAIYRGLFYRNVNSLLSYNFPVVKKIYGNERWDQLVRDFFANYESHAPLFPELPREFLQFIEQHRGTERNDPAFLLELAHYEWVELALAHATEDIEETAKLVDADGDLLAGRPALSPLAWRFSYAFPVQRLSPDYQPAEAPPQPTHLVIYRRRDDRVRFLELNPVSARAIERLSEDSGLTGEACLQSIATELGATDTKSVVEHGVQLLEQLRQREIILGTYREG